MNVKKEPPTSNGEPLRKLEWLLNRDFSGEKLMVNLRYAPKVHSLIK